MCLGLTLLSCDANKTRYDGNRIKIIEVKRSDELRTISIINVDGKEYLMTNAGGLIDLNNK